MLHTIANFLTLTLLEIVLGFDNLVFISIVAGRLPKAEQSKARRVGLLAALIMRLLFLFAMMWAAHIQSTLFTFYDIDFSVRSIIFLLGGLFLLVKSTQEIHSSLVPEEDQNDIAQAGKGKFVSAIVQIMIFDIVFSLDSVITAIGISDEFWVMAAAIIIAVIAMIFASDFLHDLLERYPTVKMLALSFLLLIGMMLIAEALGQHMPKAYLYFSIAFSLFVEILNNVARSYRKKNSKKNKQAS